MNLRRPLLIAIVLGLVATGLAWSYIGAIESELRAGSELVPVAVAAEDLPPNTVVRPELVHIVEMAKRYVPADALAVADRVAGQRLAVGVRKGNPFLQAYLTDGEPSLSFFVLASKRAMTVAVDDVSGLGGLVRPGDFVDVVAVFELGGTGRDGNGRAIARTILQNVPVLAIGQTIAVPPQPLAGANDESGRSDEIRNVTILVDAVEAQKLALAQHTGSLSLVMRSGDDNKPSILATTVERDVTGVEEAVRRYDKAPWIERREQTK